MEGNNISNEIAQKLIFVFEGLVARIPEDFDKKAKKSRKKGKWSDLARCYEIDSMMGAHLWDVVWRSPFSFDIVSFESDEEEWYEALERRLERANVPYSRLEVYASADEFAQMMAYSPNVLRVFHANPSWGFKFGNRGELVSDVQVFQLR